MNATHAITYQRLTVLHTATNGKDLVVTNRNGVKFTIPAHLVKVHSA